MELVWFLDETVVTTTAEREMCASIPETEINSLQQPSN